jgi:hypothetical protein
MRHSGSHCAINVSLLYQNKSHVKVSHSPLANFEEWWQPIQPVLNWSINISEARWGGNGPSSAAQTVTGRSAGLSVAEESRTWIFVSNASVV